MYTSAYLPSQIARERQRDMLAQASQQREARQARASRPAQPGGRRPNRALRTLLWPRTHAPA
jgi:hypothetical protein